MADAQLSHAQHQHLENESRFGTDTIAADDGIRTAVMLMNDDEKDELAEWKQKHVVSGEYGLIDWPGWESVINRING